MKLEEYHVLEAYEGVLEDLRLQRFGLVSDAEYWLARRQYYTEMFGRLQDRSQRFTIRLLINRCESNIGRVRSSIGTVDNNIEYFAIRFQEHLQGIHHD